MPTTSRHRWSDKALEAEVAKLDDEVEIYWDQNSEFCKKDVETILDNGLEGLDEVAESLVDLNIESLCQQRDEAIDRHLESMRKRHPVSQSAEDRFRKMAEDSDKLAFSANLEDLGRRTDVDLVVVVKEPELSYQSYRGVESKGQVDEICKMLELLNVNPAHLQQWVSADNENRPSYDPDPVVFPDHPERDGNEYVSLEHVHDIMLETNYGGQLLFMVRMRMSCLIENLEAFKDGPTVVKAGTWCFPFCFMNGAGPCAEMILQKDLVLEAGSYDIRLDAAMHYGVQSCYEFTGEPWKAGDITPHKKTEPCPKENTSPSPS